MLVELCNEISAESLAGMLERARRLTFTESTEEVSVVSTPAEHPVILEMTEEHFLALELAGWAVKRAT